MLGLFRDSDQHLAEALSVIERRDRYDWFSVWDLGDAYMYYDLAVTVALTGRADEAFE